MPLGPSAYRETSECVKFYKTTQKRVAVFFNYSGMYFLLAHIPSCGIIPHFYQEKAEAVIC